MQYESWGRYFKHSHRVIAPAWKSDLHIPDSPCLPYGMGRSYGDSCLNDNGLLIDSKHLNRFINFDTETGLLRCEAGVSLADILNLTVPQGWFLPVTPGTKFVTLAGAIANDVHGKNHIKAGTIGCHIKCFELLRSDGNHLTCSSEENSDFFSATIGGLGLTGFITWAEIQLIPIKTAFLNDESMQCHNLEHCLELFRESENEYDYTVAWIDCLASGDKLGRGIFSRSNHCDNESLGKDHISRKKLAVPFTFPPGCLNKLTVSAFNNLYYRKLGGPEKHSRIDYDPFFYPLDSIHHWNRLYGPKGFIQYQCVLVENALEAMKELLSRIAQSGQPSPLNVLKEFGSVNSPGMLSFPRKGLTLALDFPFRGEKTLTLLNELDTIVKQANGALYPAKDSRMSAEMFEMSFPNLAKFKKHMDPAFSSSFWRRVTQD